MMRRECAMQNLKFSVSICVYGGDRADWFCAAVDSMIHQTCKPDEIVLTVDGPVPQTLDRLIAEYEKRDDFCIVRLEENQGLGNARRKGLAYCKHDIVALMDADDISLPDRCAKQLAMFASDSELDIVGGNIAEFIGERDNIVSIREVPTTDVEIKEYMKKRCPLNHMSVMFKKSSVDKVGGYFDWYHNEDYYLWLRMALAGMKFANLPDVLVNVRIDENMYRRRGGLKYFISEINLQGFMLQNKMINTSTYWLNICKRFIIQICLPSRWRGWVYKKFARTSLRINNSSKSGKPLVR